MERICAELAERKLVSHKTPQKNWDHHLLIDLLEATPKESRIMDLGSGGGLTLELLHQLGFKNIRGMEFVVPPIRLKNRLIRLFKPDTFQPCYHITKGDIVRTGLPDGDCDVITCISVLEHGVDPEKFLRESARLLTRGGRLLLTFDYWEDFRPEDHSEKQIFGLPWNIFNREKVTQMIAWADKFGLTPLANSEIPPCRERVVSYAGRDYTFMALGLQKQA